MPVDAAKRKANKGFCSLMTKIRIVESNPSPTTCIISIIHPLLEQKNGLDLLQQIIQQPDDHEQHHDKPDERHPMRHIFFSHLFENGVNHGNDDAYSRNLKNCVHLNVHTLPPR